MIKCPANDLFGRHIARTAKYQAGHGLDCRGWHTRDAKIGNLCVPPANDHDVGWFDITVDDVIVMGKSKSLRDLRDPVHNRRDDGQLFNVGKNILELLAVEKLHGHIRHVFIATDIINCDDIRVVQPTGSLDLLLKARFKFFNFITAQVQVDSLDRNGAVDHGIDRLIDDAHRALPDDAQNLVAAQRLNHYFFGVAGFRLAFTVRKDGPHAG